MKKIGYFKNSLQATYFRTLDAIDLDNGGKIIPGISWTKSIYLMFYYWIKKLIKTLI
jgi:hypothetical protein